MNYSVTEAAKLLNISKEAVYNRARRGSLKSFKENNRLYIIIDDDAKLPITGNEFAELKHKYINLLAAYEALKLSTHLSEEASVGKAKWLILSKYVKKFPKSKRKKVKKYLLKRLGKSKKIKIEDNEIYVKNVKLRKF